MSIPQPLLGVLSHEYTPTPTRDITPSVYPPPLLGLLPHEYTPTSTRGIIINIIIIKRGRQYKAEREWYTSYQSEDPSPTIPTYRQKEYKW